MVPLMENGGNGKHFPWVFDEETVNIYRDFAKMHTNMLPFFLTKGTEAYAKKVSVIKPLATRQFRFSRNYPNNWGYILGNDYLVYPVLNDGGIV
jgi:alpha-glucosidase (family GH31 glycosyl hydrolase)